MNAERTYYAMNRTASKRAVDAYKLLPYRQRNGTVSGKEEAQILTQWRTTLKRVEAIEESVLTYEDDNSIQERWIPGSPEFIEGQRSVAMMRYREALNNLEHLVVQHLLELTKLNVSGVGKHLYLL
jgi:hypothetical protein